MDFLGTFLIGLAVTVIGGLILYFIFGVGKAQKSDVTKKSLDIKGNGNITAGRDIILDSKNLNKNKANYSPFFSAKKIIESIRDAAPYQRDSIAETYKGIKISLTVKLKHITKSTNSKWYLLFEDNDNAWIDCYINPKDYPELKRVNNESFRMDGEIINVSVSTVTLKNCTLYLKDLWV